jgi:hypothetical protein
MNNYSTKRVSEELIKEVVEALKNIRGWGSVEIIVQDHKVVQITERNIKKTNSVMMNTVVSKIGA